jgi:hypothetical protein
MREAESGFFSLAKLKVNLRAVATLPAHLSEQVITCKESNISKCINLLDMRTPFLAYVK